MSVNIATMSVRPPRVSLLSSSEILDIPGEKWFAGVEFMPLSSEGSSGVLVPCASDEKSAATRSESLTVKAYGIYATDECTSFGSGATDFIQRAKDKLAVVEPWWMERQLWEDTNVMSNPSFVGNTTTTTVASNKSALHAFSRLDSAVAQDTTDGRGMIHVPTIIWDLLPVNNLLRREGNVWYSPLDNIVVPGRGYTGNGPNPDGGANANAATDSLSWMFGHPGTIQIARGRVTTLPEADKLEAQMNRQTNDIRALAERVVIVIPSVSFELSLYAASVNITAS